MSGNSTVLVYGQSLAASLTGVGPVVTLTADSEKGLCFSGGPATRSDRANEAPVDLPLTALVPLYEVDTGTGFGETLSSGMQLWLDDLRGSKFIHVNNARSGFSADQLALGTQPFANLVASARAANDVSLSAFGVPAPPSHIVYAQLYTDIINSVEDQWPAKAVKFVADIHDSLSIGSQVPVYFYIHTGAGAVASDAELDARCLRMEEVFKLFDGKNYILTQGLHHLQSRYVTSGGVDMDGLHLGNFQAKRFGEHFGLAARRRVLDGECHMLTPDSITYPTPTTMLINYKGVDGALTTRSDSVTPAHPTLGYRLKRNDIDLTITDVAVQTSSVLITFSEALTVGDSVQLRYAFGLDHAENWGLDSNGDRGNIVDSVTCQYRHDGATMYQWAVPWVEAIPVTKFTSRVNTIHSVNPC